MGMLQVQKELIWKPGEFNEDTDGNCPLKSWTDSTFPSAANTYKHRPQQTPRAGYTAQPHLWNSTSASPKNQAPGSSQLVAQMPQPYGTTRGTSAELPISHLKPKQIIHEEIVLHVDRG